VSDARDGADAIYSPRSTSRIEDYALIGDLQTAALVDRQGSIDWCCFPRFDSGACFAALLGGPEHGRWLLAPAVPIVRTARRYRQDTLIVETVHETEEGSVRMIDLMPPRGHTPDIVRIVEGLSGNVAMRMELIIRYDHGRILPWVRTIEDSLVAIAGPDALCLRTPVAVRGQDMTTVGEFTVSPGERIPFVLTWYPSHERLPEITDPEEALNDAENYWLDWSRTFADHTDYHEEIRQSLLVLKAMTYAPTGGIVAAPTTSLPELVGGVRNWDYRFCWLRDATLTLLAMLKAGSSDEAIVWRAWLLRAIAGDPADMQIMYGIAGERRLDERELDWLPGHDGSRPVRVGNAASEQLQLDVYGEVIDALYQTRLSGAPADDDVWSLTRKLLEWLEDGWQMPDAGIWEVRGPARHFTHSKVMAWVAFDRAVKSVEEWGRQGPVEKWRAIRDRIRAEVFEQGWSETKQAYVQSYGSQDLDASALLMPTVGFVAADDPRFVSTVDAIRKELTVDGLLLRYRTEDEAEREENVDGLPQGEGVFLPCSFWLASVLAMQGKIEEARELFERLLDLRNDVGLLSEEYDPRARRLLGNFPQAFTHLALIDTAFVLTEGRGLKDPSAAAAGNE
jgi:GH15 family glucan-1,4-alpha-glucosidase